MPISAAPHLLRVLRSDRLPNRRAKFGAASVLIAHRLWRACYMLRLMAGSGRAG